MTADNLPAVRTGAALATRPQPTGQSARQHQVTPALPLDAALFGAALAGVFLAAVSGYAHRYEQAALVGVAALGLLIAAGVAFYQERLR